MILIGLKIGLTGTHSAGKTTLAHQVKDVLELNTPHPLIVPTVETNLVRDVGTTLGIKRCDEMLEDREVMRHFQQAILQRYFHITREHPQKPDGYSIIYDRTLMDIRAYLIGYERMFDDRPLDLEEDPLDQHELRILVNSARYCVAYYDVITYVSPIVISKPEMEVEYADEFRPTDWELRGFIDQVTRKTLAEVISYTQHENVLLPVAGYIDTTEQNDRVSLLIGMIEDARLMERLNTWAEESTKGER